MKTQVKPFGIGRNLDYMRTKVYLLFKHLKEYKIDLYLSLLSNFTTLVSYYIYYVVFFNFVDVLNWTNLEYLLFFFTIWIGTLASMNFSLRKFHLTILTGRLNVYLYIPVNRYLSSIMDNTSGRNMFTAILNFFVFLGLTIYFGYSYNLIFLSCIILFSGILSFVIFNNFVFTFAFFIKGIGIIYNDIVKEVIYLNEKFTPVMFEGSYFKDFFYLLPSAFYGYFVIEALRGNFSIMLHYLPYFILINFILMIITHFIFNYGLKKYEAFG